MRVCYADPPYPGCAHLYADHPDYAGEVDHAELAQRLVGYDGFCLHTSSPALHDVETHVRGAGIRDYRVMAWVKPFAAVKANVPVAYAWEPVLVRPCRQPVVAGYVVMRDWIAEPITLQRGLTGVKPDAVCRWLFEVMGMERDDELDDLYPGSGAVTRAWEAWRAQLSLLDGVA
jgi:hypothetical protein